MKKQITRKKLLFCLLFFLVFSQIVHADLKDPSIMSVTEGEPDLNIVDCVNALTGDFLVQQQDLVIQGAQPLPLQRFYISGNGEGELRGWIFYPHQKSILLRETKRSPLVSPMDRHFNTEDNQVKPKINRRRKRSQRKVKTRKRTLHNSRS